ncbi:hypothetical protein GOE04_11675 [Sinorhizobium medicae]|uniref:hypothetical protein n=1 Tax=Sinorhizobium medicae TaxID=110321 RepID=UPI001AACEC14|nr:hypothetical protein [Sinorhizobium medicae]MBO1943187.1 hypothetical protein [Sinorhizobium medicae]MDX0921827.1 hypothetical protein [Sinorhizobium medicae]MDX0934130.1 hypothetical protein [Sinorhizobium medicae]MDX0940290.1 hypothetical protein [Sinorhizobium medicae]MDX1025212.1 hypothetical protein [Sinorhizobium medicae]
MLTSHNYTDAVLPTGIDLLDDVFTQILSEKGLCRDSEAAELIARRLFSLYQCGHRETKMLRDLAVGD